MSYQR